MAISKEKLEQYWAGQEAACKAEPVLSGIVDAQLRFQIRIMEELRAGKEVQRRLRPHMQDGSPTPGGIWHQFSLKLTDAVVHARLDFDSFEYRLAPEEKDITVWVAIAPSGRVLATFTEKDQMEKYAMSPCMNVRIIPLCATVEVL